MCVCFRYSGAWHMCVKEDRVDMTSLRVLALQSANRTIFRGEFSQRSSDMANEVGKFWKDFFDSPSLQAHLPLPLENVHVTRFYKHNHVMGTRFPHTKDVPMTSIRCILKNNVGTNLDGNRCRVGWRHSSSLNSLAFLMSKLSSLTPIFFFLPPILSHGS